MDGHVLVPFVDSEVFPSHQSSPIYGNPLASDTLKHEMMNKARDDLQRQIDILKSVSNHEIKRLKSRIYFLENKLDEITAPNPTVTHSPNFFSSAVSTKCTKGTPTKSCPHILRIVKISQIYNKTLCSSTHKVSIILSYGVLVVLLQFFDTKRMSLNVYCLYIETVGTRTTESHQLVAIHTM